jgi:hypothetical protein
MIPMQKSSPRVSAFTENGLNDIDIPVTGGFAKIPDLERIEEEEEQNTAYNKTLMTKNRFGLKASNAFEFINEQRGLLLVGGMTLAFLFKIIQ